MRLTDTERIIQALNISENTLAALITMKWVPKWCKKSLGKDLRKVSKARAIAEDKWP